MIYLFWVACLLAIALFLSVLFDKKIELTFAPAIFTSIIVMYLFGIFGALYYGLFAVIALALACGVFVVWRMVREKKLFAEKWLTPGCVILLAFVVIIARMHANRIPAWGDEFSHWAYTVKIMYFNDALTITVPDASLYPDYPPATALLEYMFVRFTPDFTESYMYRALTLLQVSLILPITGFFDWNRFHIAAISFFSLFLIPTLFNYSVYTLLQIDILLGILFFWMLFVWLTAEKTDTFTIASVIAGGIVLILTKKSGVIFWSFVLCLIVLDFVAKNRKIPKKEKALRSAARRPSLQFAGGGILALASWAVLTNIYVPQQAGTFPLVNVWDNIKTLFSPWSEYQQLVAENYINRLISESFSTKIAITPLLWCVLCAALLSFVFHRMPDTARPYSLRQQTLCVLYGGLVLYLFFMFYSYSFIFTRKEGEITASWTRYLSSYLVTPALLSVSLLLLVIYYYPKAKEQKKLNSYPALVTLGIVLLLTPSLVFFFLPKTNVKENEFLTTPYLRAEKFPVELRSDDIVYCWKDDSSRTGINIIRYNLYPTEISVSAGFNMNIPNPEYSAYSTDTSPAELARALESCDYLYIQNISEYSQEKYAELFEDTPSSGSVYEISVESGELKLEKIS